MCTRVPHKSSVFENIEIVEILLFILKRLIYLHLYSCCYLFICCFVYTVYRLVVPWYLVYQFMYVYMFLFCEVFCLHLLSLFFFCFTRMFFILYIFLNKL